MTYRDDRAREELVEIGRSMFERGLTRGASANMSVRTETGFMITPTNSCIGFLQSEQLSVLDLNGKWIRGDKPSKEFSLHKAFYDQRPDASAVVHLHSTYATALSCLDLSEDELFPPLTPYLLIRLGRVLPVPYFSPGDQRLADAVYAVAAKTAGVLMANHGPIVAGADLRQAMYAIEELEESARITLLLQGKPIRQIPDAGVAELLRRYGHQPE